MTKINQTIQGNMDSSIFKCYCGENSYLEVIKDPEDKQIYISITLRPTRLRERLKLAYRALRGLEFTSSNEVVIDGDDIKELIKALKLNDE